MRFLRIAYPNGRRVKRINIDKITCITSDDGNLIIDYGYDETATISGLANAEEVADWIVSQIVRTSNDIIVVGRR